MRPERLVRSLNTLQRDPTLRLTLAETIASAVLALLAEGQTRILLISRFGTHGAADAPRPHSYLLRAFAAAGEALGTPVLALAMPRVALDEKKGAAVDSGAVAQFRRSKTPVVLCLVDSGCAAAAAASPASASQAPKRVLRPQKTRMLPGCAAGNAEESSSSRAMMRQQKGTRRIRGILLSRALLLCLPLLLSAPLLLPLQRARHSALSRAVSGVPPQATSFFLTPASAPLPRCCCTVPPSAGAPTSRSLGSIFAAMALFLWDT